MNICLEIRLRLVILLALKWMYQYLIFVRSTYSCTHIPLRCQFMKIFNGGYAHSGRSCYHFFEHLSLCLLTLQLEPARNNSDEWQEQQVNPCCATSKAALFASPDNKNQQWTLAYKLAIASLP